MITELELSDTELEEDVVSIPADPDVKNFSFTVVNEEVYYRENSVMNRMELPAMTAERVKGHRQSMHRLLPMDSLCFGWDVPVVPPDPPALSG